MSKAQGAMYLCIGSICHTILAQHDEIIKKNLRAVELVTVSVFLEKNRNREYDSRIKNSFMK